MQELSASLRSVLCVQKTLTSPEAQHMLSLALWAGVSSKHHLLPLTNPRLWPYPPDHLASAIFDPSDRNSNPFSFPFAEVYS